MVFEEAVVAASKAERRTRSTWKYTMWASCQSNGIEAMWHVESRLRVPVQVESRLSVPVQDGVQTLKSTGIAIDTRGTWSIPREETTWIDSVLLRRTQSHHAGSEPFPLIAFYTPFELQVIHFQFSKSAWKYKLHVICTLTYIFSVHARTTCSDHLVFREK